MHFIFQCLETCVKNCGRRFHIQVANKDFLNDMVKVIGPKYDPPQALQEKVLSMIQVMFVNLCSYVFGWFWVGGFWMR